MSPEAGPPAASVPGAASGEGARIIELPTALTVKELADLIGVGPIEVIKELIKNGVMASINQTIDFDTAAVVAHDLGLEPREAGAAPVQPAAPAPAAEETAAPEEEEDPAVLQPRPPVVTVLGHVDHGKTSLLDVIRKSRVVDQEAGGITQHIGAYLVEVDGHRVTFIDTPGHEAFTAMRARGAQVTDIAVLVVAADDGVMPQTVEAINHARAAGVPIVVAINKMDLADANPDRVKQQLLEQGLVPEEWGGETIMVPVSARTTEGIQGLLENLVLVAELQELKANPRRRARGSVLEAELDPSRGPTATVLVQTGTLRAADVVVVGDTWGRVRAMFDEKGRRVREAGPSDPVVILGLGAVPRAGDLLSVVEDERTARALVERRERQRQLAAAEVQRPVSLDTLFGELTAGEVKELNVVLKTDVQGTTEAIRQALERLSSDEVRVKVIHAASGSVTESDIMLASASRGLVIGFDTRTEPTARRQAQQEGVEIRTYTIIYHLLEDIQKAMTGLLEPVYVDVREGLAEVRQVFRVGRRGQAAGCLVTEGAIRLGALARVRRGNAAVHDSRVASLRRFQDEVREVQVGLECGVGFEGFTEFEEGDVIECYRRERQR